MGLLNQGEGENWFVKKGKDIVYAHSSQSNVDDRLMTSIFDKYVKARKVPKMMGKGYAETSFDADYGNDKDFEHYRDVIIQNWDTKENRKQLLNMTVDEILSVPKQDRSWWEGTFEGKKNYYLPSKKKEQQKQSFASPKSGLVSLGRSLPL